MYIIFDTETTGLPQNYNAPISDTDNWPRMVQLAWQLHDAKGGLMSRGNEIVRPEGYDIPFSSTKIHGITTERAQRDGKPLHEVLGRFLEDARKANFNVGHNIEFDVNVVGCELFRKEMDTALTEMKQLDTMKLSTDFVAIPGRGGRFKFPQLTELHTKLFGKPFEAAHDAAYDVDATAKCFFGLLSHSVIPLAEGVSIGDLSYEAPELEAANFDNIGLEEVQTSTVSRKDINTAKDLMEGKTFTHLHNHSQFSILQATSDIPGLVSKAKELGMPAVAITDYGNMMSAFHFVREAFKQGIKPILGCELNLCKDHTNKDYKDNGYHLVLLAKNKKGYLNISKMSSVGYTDGFYYVPRIDRTVLEKYKDDVICLTGGLWGEVPHKLLNNGEAEAEEASEGSEQEEDKD